MPADSGEAGVGARHRIGLRKQAQAALIAEKRACSNRGPAYLGRIAGVGLRPQWRNPQDNNNAPIQRHRTHRRRHPQLRGGARPAGQIPHGGTGEVAARFRPQDRPHLRRMGIRDRFSRPASARNARRAGRSSSCLSDVLGVSMLVDAVNHREREGATETTVLGPFYVGEHKAMPHGTDISPNLTGEKMFVQGRVTDLAGKPSGRTFRWTSGTPTMTASTIRKSRTTKREVHRRGHASSPTPTAGSSFAPSCRAAIRSRPMVRSGK